MFAVPYDDSGREYSYQFDCHRFPPQVYGEHANNRVAIFPQVGKDAWCGEFRAVVEPPSKGEITSRFTGP